MKQSYILQQFFKSFHQPPSLGKKESSKLLETLTTSFRQQLDREHGGFDFRKDNLHRTTSTNKPATRRRSLSEPVLPTERHFRSIITDPLFVVSSSGSKKPMHVFELAVSKGSMTIGRCRNCLAAEKRMIINSGTPTVWKGMRDSGAGLKVLKWLKSSGLAEGGGYLKQTKFLDVLAEFVVAEGLQEAIWHDFTELCSSSTITTHTARQVLFHIISAELKSPDSLDGGISSLTRAFSLLHSSAQRTSIMLPALRLISHRCTVLSHLHSKPTPENLSSLRHIISQVMVKPRAHLAHLDLLHPTNPSPLRALHMLREFSHDDPRINGNKKLFCLGLDTAKYLLEHDRVTEAREVLNLMSCSLPGQREGDQIGHAKHEASNLEWLQGLSLV